jgi:hypothetical protein
MATFGVVVEPVPAVEEFITKTKTRLLDNNMVRNPFRGDIKTLFYTDTTVKKIVLIYMRPLYMDFSIFGWITLFSTWYIWGFIWYLFIPGLLVGCSGIFWRKEFYYYIFKLGLKKAGYTGSIKLISSKDILEKIYFSEVI